MKNSIELMQAEIVDKNSRITKIEITNKRLYTQNKHLMELVVRGKMLGERDKKQRVEEKREVRKKTWEITETQKSKQRE